MFVLPLSLEECRFSVLYRAANLVISLNAHWLKEDPTSNIVLLQIFLGLFFPLQKFVPASVEGAS